MPKAIIVASLSALCFGLACIGSTVMSIAVFALMCVVCL